MIDMHAHILPDKDDGPETLEESLDMAQIAVKNGIHAVVASPHTLNGIYQNQRQDVLDGCHLLNCALEKQDIPLKILPGSEIYMCPEIIDELEHGRLMTLNDAGRHICLELPEPFVPKAVISLIEQLKRMGITPIINHPERSLIIQQNLHLAHALNSSGALFQIVAGSLTGIFGKPAYKCTIELIRAQLVHFMVSDAHSPVFRTPNIKKAIEKLRKLAGNIIADQILIQNPEAIINGEAVIMSFQPTR